MHFPLHKAASHHLLGKSPWLVFDLAESREEDGIKNVTTQRYNGQEINGEIISSVNLEIGDRGQSLPP